MRKATDAN